MLRWGLIPYWAKDIKVGFVNINAKAEGIESKPAFRKAFERRRCLVPVDNFYEWKKTAAGKQPYAIALADRGIMALAGLWENWRAPGGEWMRSFAIITTSRTNCAPSSITACRCPKPEAWPAWLGEEPADETRLKALLAPYPVRRHVVLAGERARRQRQKQRPVADQTGCRSLNHKRRPKSIAGHITYARRVPQSTTHGGFKMPLRKVSLRNPAGSENPAVSPWLCQLI